MSMTRDEELLARRFVDLSRQAQQRDTVLFSEYLNLNELNIFHQGISELYSSFEMSGGYAWSERQMIAFIPDAFCYAWNYPIACLEITPVNQKFAEELSHRDVLGTLMGLGIERGRLGDILVDGGNIHVFCHEKVAGYLQEQVSRIRHTTVQARQVQPDGLQLEPKVEICEGIVSSNRLDGIVACLCKISRGQASQMIRSGKVFLNHREVVQVSRECKEQELISIRSVGRFRFLGCQGETRKGKVRIRYEKYI